MGAYHRLSLLLIAQILRSVVLTTCVMEMQTLRDSVTAKWALNIENFMSLFKACKIQIVVLTMKETEEMLGLAGYYGTKLQSGILVHSALDEYGNENEILFPSQYRASSFRNNVAEGWRYTRCYVQLFPTEFLMAPSKIRNVGILTLLPKILMFTRDNPSYVILLLQNDEFEDNSLYTNALPSFIKPSISSTYAVIRNGKFIDIICVPCFQENGYLRSGLVRPYVTVGSVVELEDIKLEWQKANDDLLLGPVVWVGERTKTQCHPLKDKLLLPPLDCALLIIAKKLNFTMISISTSEYVQPISKNHSQFTLGKVLPGYSHPDLFRFILQHNNSEALEWSFLGTGAQNFRTIAVLDIHEIKITAFWRALDLPSWICTFVAAISLTLGFVALGTHTLKFSQLLSALAATLVFLIDHSLTPVWSKYVKFPTSAAVLLFLWAQVAMMISSGYRGALFSLLASTQAPVIPQGMEELASCNDLVVTSAIYGDVEKNTSLLHKTIHEFREETQNATLSSVQHVRKSADKFGKKLEFLYSSTIEILYSQTERGADYELQRGDDKPPIRLPSNYIMVGTTSFCSMYSLLMNAIGKKLMIVKGEEIPLVMEHAPLLVFRNFLAYQFSRVLYGVVESGMWERWERYYTVYKYKLNRDMLRDLVQGNGTKKVGLPDNNIMAALFTASESKLMASTRRPSETTTLHVLQPIFCVYFVMAAISLALLMLEIVNQKINLSIASIISVKLQFPKLRTQKRDMQNPLYIYLPQSGSFVFNRNLALQS